jgi:hypothetical protein
MAGVHKFRATLPLALFMEGWTTILPLSGQCLSNESVTGDFRRYRRGRPSERILGTPRPVCGTVLYRRTTSRRIPREFCTWPRISAGNASKSSHSKDWEPAVKCSDPFANSTTEENRGPKGVGSHQVRARVFGGLTGDTENGGERFVTRDLEREARFYEPNVPRGRFRWDKIG